MRMIFLFIFVPDTIILLQRPGKGLQVAQEINMKTIYQAVKQ